MTTGTTPVHGPALTSRDLRLIASARELAAESGPDELIRRTGQSGREAAYAYAFGEAKHLLAALADAMERLAEAGASGE